MLTALVLTVFISSNFPDSPFGLTEKSTEAEFVETMAKRYPNAKAKWDARRYVNGLATLGATSAISIEDWSRCHARQIVLKDEQHNLTRAIFKNGKLVTLFAEVSSEEYRDLMAFCQNNGYCYLDVVAMFHTEFGSNVLEKHYDRELEAKITDCLLKPKI